MQSKMARRPGIRIVSCEPSPIASEFSQFFSKIISNLYNMDSREFLNKVKEELKNIRRLKYFADKPDGKNWLVDTKFEDLAVRCAYMYSYSVLDVGIVYREFSKHLKTNASTFNERFSSKCVELRMCCLAGGAGTEAIGICKAIYDVIWKFTSKVTNSVMFVYITIVDLCQEWQFEETAIQKALNSDAVLFPSMIIKFHVDFLKADLLQPFQKKLKTIINKADVVTIVNFMYAVYGRRPLECISKLQSMMQVVIDCMAEESCLFMLEPAGGVVFRRAAEVIGSYPNAFERKMMEHDGYQLHPKTMKEIEGLMDFRKFAEKAPLFPTLMRRVSSCMWIKKPVPKNKTCNTQQKVVLS